MTDLKQEVLHLLGLLKSTLLELSGESQINRTMQQVSRGRSIERRNRGSLWEMGERRERVQGEEVFIGPVVHAQSDR